MVQLEVQKFTFEATFQESQDLAIYGFRRSECTLASSNCRVDFALFVNLALLQNFDISGNLRYFG